MTELKTYVFSWNTQTVRYNLPDCPQENFIDQICKGIIHSQHNYDLVAIAFQEDATRDSPLLDLFKDSLKTKYTLLKETVLSGWGSTTIKALRNELDYRPRGVKIGVFSRIDLNIFITRVEAKEMVCPGIRNWITSGKGGVAINLQTTIGDITFLNMHLPFEKYSILNKGQYRKKEMLWQAECMSSLYEETIEYFKPDYIILMGDLNFRNELLDEPNASTVAKKIFDRPAFIIELIENHDELRKLINKSYLRKRYVPILKEGVQNSGPIFLPTCKMAHNREHIDKVKEKAYLLGFFDQRVPSWCDRILYKGYDLECLEYNRLDIGNMNLSDHAAVMGVFSIKL